MPVFYFESREKVNIWIRLIKCKVGTNLLNKKLRWTYFLQVEAIMGGGIHDNSWIKQSYLPPIPHMQAYSLQTDLTAVLHLSIIYSSMIPFFWQGVVISFIMKPVAVHLGIKDGLVLRPWPLRVRTTVSNSSCPCTHTGRTPGRWGCLTCTCFSACHLITSIIITVWTR